MFGKQCDNTLPTPPVLTASSLIDELSYVSVRIMAKRFLSSRSNSSRSSSILFSGEQNVGVENAKRGSFQLGS